LLKNPVYIGEIRHKNRFYKGQHEAIVDRDTWEQAQALLQAGSKRTRSGVSSEATLRGKIFDGSGRRMTPTHSKKADGRHYRYYVSRLEKTDPTARGKSIMRISAELAERLVNDAVRTHTESDSVECVERVVVLPSEVRVFLNQAPTPIVIPYLISRRGNQMHARTTSTDGSQTRAPDRALLHALVKACRWRRELTTGHCRSTTEIANAEGTSRGYANALLRLAFLSPDLTEAILDGRQSERLSLAAIRANPVPLAWSEQRTRYA
jgi:hypothetical protein